MRVFALLAAALPLAFASEEVASLRGANRELSGEQMFFQGWAMSGTNGAVPVNGCFGYDHNSNQLNQCDGKAAADMFCREKHYGHSTGYHIVALNGQAPRSVVLGANHQELELHIPNQHVLADVTCGR